MELLVELQDVGGFRGSGHLTIVFTLPTSFPFETQATGETLPGNDSCQHRSGHSSAKVQNQALRHPGTVTRGRRMG